MVRYGGKSYAHAHGGHGGHGGLCPREYLMLLRKAIYILSNSGLIDYIKLCVIRTKFLIKVLVIKQFILEYALFLTDYYCKQISEYTAYFPTLHLYFFIVKYSGSQAW